MNLGTFTFSDIVTFMFQAIVKALKMNPWLSQAMAFRLLLPPTVHAQQ